MMIEFPPQRKWPGVTFAKQMKRRERSFNKVEPKRRTKRKCKTEEVKKDNFERVPDDLLLSIFNRISDFKFVCRCSVVCKRFASVVTLMDTVTVSFSSKECEASEVQAHVRHFRDKKVSLHSQVTPKMDITCLRQTLNFINCLRKFRELKSLHIKFSYGLKAWSSSVLEWKAKFATELEYVVTLLPASVEKQNTQEPGQELEVGDIPWPLNEAELEQRLYMAYGCCQEAVVRQTLSFMLIDHHPMLRSVTITDNEEQGMMCIQEEQILKLRNMWIDKNLEQIFEAVKVPHIFKVGYVPVVRLPGSGYLLKGVLLLIFKPLEEPCTGGKDSHDGGHDDDDDDDDDGELLNWQYDGEEMFKETVREILMNHKERMHMVIRGAGGDVAA